MNPIRRLRQEWTATPLSRRMVLLIVLLLTSALGLVGAVMVNILERHLITQVDEQLMSSARGFANSISDGAELPDRNPYPTDYYIRRNVIGQDELTVLTSDTLERAGEPIVGDLIELGYRVGQNGTTHPITVQSTKPGATWRVVAVPMALTHDQTPAGSVTVGLPLIGISETIVNTALWFFLAGLSIIFAAGVLGYYLVSRSLQSLRQIESVAEKIAAGDLSKRIPQGAPGTEVGSLAASLNGMLSQIEDSFNARDESEQKVRRFISDASHELRTPLAAIRGYAELYRMGGVPDEKAGEVMGRIESESTRMGSLVEDLLVLARLDEKRPLDLEPVDLIELARNAASDLEALDPTRTVKVQGLSSRKLPRPIVVNADRDQLTQVAVNIVGNISRYTPEASPVEILIGIDDGWAVIEFRDHGPGIPPEEQDRVFERFYRTDKSRARSLGGSGLGLSIISGIVEAHAGIVKLIETKRGGLTVRVQLPVTG